MQSTTKPEPMLVSPKTAARRLDISLRQVWTLIASGKLRTIKLSPRCTRIPESDLRRLAEGAA